MKRTQQALVGLCGIGVAGCDQAVKQVAVATLQGKPVTELLGGVVRMQYAENPGAFLRLGATLPDPWRSALFGGLTLVLLCGFGVWLWRSDRIADVGLLGGALIWAAASATLSIGCYETAGAWSTT